VFAALSRNRSAKVWVSNYKRFPVRNGTSSGRDCLADVNETSGLEITTLEIFGASRIAVHAIGSRLVSRATRSANAGTPPMATKPIDFKRQAH
jgi:hypothetical protein